MTTPRIQCYECKHYIKDFICNAYKKDIPKIIFFNEHDHTKPFKGDNGIQFEPIKEK